MIEGYIVFLKYFIGRNLLTLLHNSIRKFLKLVSASAQAPDRFVSAASILLYLEAFVVRAIPAKAHRVNYSYLLYLV